MGVVYPLRDATEATFYSDAWDNFDNTGKQFFSYLEESRKSKKFLKVGCTPPINPSQINPQIKIFFIPSMSLFLL